MTTAHSWVETLEIERQGEIVLDAMFGEDHIIVRATKAHQKKKVDRFFIKRNDVVIHVVDYKIDRKAAETRRLALEHVSVKRGQITQARGWIHTTAANLIVSYVPAWDSAFLMEVAALRNSWDDIMRQFPPLPTTTNRGPDGRLMARPYQTLCCCVDITWLLKAGLISRRMDAVGSQLRLRLTGRANG